MTAMFRPSVLLGLIVGLSAAVMASLTGHRMVTEINDSTPGRAVPFWFDIVDLFKQHRRLRPASSLRSLFIASVAAMLAALSYLAREL